jgi:preprotein translocase subunit YajC
LLRKQTLFLCLCKGSKEAKPLCSVAFARVKSNLCRGLFLLPLSFACAFPLLLQRQKAKEKQRQSKGKKVPIATGRRVLSTGGSQHRRVTAKESNKKGLELKLIKCMLSHPAFNFKLRL